MTIVHFGICCARHVKTIELFAGGTPNDSSVAEYKSNFCRLYDHCGNAKKHYGVDMGLHCKPTIKNIDDNSSLLSVKSDCISYSSYLLFPRYDPQARSVDALIDCRAADWRNSLQHAWCELVHKY